MMPENCEHGKIALQGENDQAGDELSADVVKSLLAVFSQASWLDCKGDPEDGKQGIEWR